MVSTMHTYLDVGNPDLLTKMGLKNGDLVETPFHSSAWVAPNGDFYVAEGYDHFGAAREICERKLYHVEEWQSFSEVLETRGWLHLWYNGEWWLARNRRLTADQFFVLQLLAHEVKNHQYRAEMYKALLKFGDEFLDGRNERNWFGGD